MYLCRRCFISVRALREIKISLCLWEERGRGGEGQSVRINVCVWGDEIRMHRVFFFPLLLQMSVCVFVHDRGCNSHVVQSKTSRQKKKKKKMWQKVQNHELTSATSDTRLWSQVRNISSPHRRHLHTHYPPHFFLLLLHQNNTAGFCENVCSSAWKHAGEDETGGKKQLCS